MTINDFITEVYCFIDDDYKKLVKNIILRKRGFKPRLSDSEVITMEIVGEYLGHDRDTHIWRYFKNDKSDIFSDGFHYDLLFFKYLSIHLLYFCELRRLEQYLFFSFLFCIAL